MDAKTFGENQHNSNMYSHLSTCYILITIQSIVLLNFSKFEALAYSLLNIISHPVWNRVDSQ